MASKEKKLPHTQMSDVKCAHPGCRKHLKQNVVNRIPEADKCYQHFKAAQMAKRN